MLLITVAVIVAQLAEQSIQITGVDSSNPVFGKIEHISCLKDENNEKEAGNGPF